MAVKVVLDKSIGLNIVSIYPQVIMCGGANPLHLVLVTCLLVMMVNNSFDFVFLLFCFRRGWH